MSPCKHCNCQEKHQPKNESVWIEGVSKRTYPPLQSNMSVDVVIVGGGITGLTAAYLLKQAGKKVAVLEAAQIGSGVTSYTTAHVTEVLDVRFQDMITRFGLAKAKAVATSQRAAIEHIAAIVEREKINCDFSRVPGYLYAQDQKYLGELQKERQAVEIIGLKVSFLDRVPLPFSTVGAIRFDDQAQFHPLKFIHSLAESVHGDGSFVFEGAHVQEIDEKSPHQIKTNQGMVTAPVVILATHTPILKILSLQAKIASYRSYVVGFTPEEGKAPEGLFWDMEHPYHYIRNYRTADKTIVIVGGEDYRQGAIKDTTLPYKKLKKYVCDHFPGAALEYQWSAQLFNSYDGLPFIGLLPGYEKVYGATGFSGNGITGGALSALILSDMVQGKENVWAPLYDPKRLTVKGVWRKFLQQQVYILKQVLRDRFMRKPKQVADHLKPGEGALIALKGKAVAVYRDEQGNLTNLSPVCPHAGCTVQWNASEKTWDCPCHGSRFSATGQVKEGPAVRNLARLAE